MKHNLDEMKKRMPEAIRDVDYFNHIVICQNDEIIRLLKKLAGEEDQIINVANLSTEVFANLPTQETVQPKATRRSKKTEV